MKTPIWEQSPGALLALLNAGSFVQAHLYTITLQGGDVIRITDADTNIGYDGTVWSSRNVRVNMDESRATASWKRGLDVDSWQLVIIPRLVEPITGEQYPDKIGDVPWIPAARGGALDGADVQIDRAYLAEWPQPYQAQVEPVGVITIFAGTPAEVDTNDTVVAITVNDYRELLSITMPRRLYQSNCIHTLFDSGCALDQADFDVPTMCIGGTTRASLKSNVAAPGGSGTFTLGKVVMTSGQNAGFSRTVREWTLGTFTLLNPLPFDVLPGDTFTAYPGCDKQMTTCALFANLDNFGGTPFIPAAETAI